MESTLLPGSALGGDVALSKFDKLRRSAESVAGGRVIDNGRGGRRRCQMHR